MGMSAAALGVASFSLLQVGSSAFVVGGTFALVGLGLGMVLPQATNAVLASVPRERSGMGSAVNDAVGELGGSLGVAILGAAMALTYRLHIEDAIAAAGDAARSVPPAALEAARESLAAASLVAGRLPGDLVEPFRRVTSEAFTSGMGWALLLGASVMAAGAVLAWLRFPDRVERAEE
jgi:DHA2 family multidrug resistance protein-like MFS transporter